MTEQITLEQVLKLVSFIKRPNGNWKVLTVYYDVLGKVYGDVQDVSGNVLGDVHGDVRGHVWGDVCGKINDREWKYVPEDDETPQEKLERLILESGDQELIEAFNQQQQQEGE